MPRIIIPYLTIGGEKVPTPHGLSELLDPYWDLAENVDRTEVNKIADQYDFVDYKTENGNWATKCIPKKKSKASK